MFPIKSKDGVFRRHHFEIVRIRVEMRVEASSCAFIIKLRRKWVGMKMSAARLKLGRMILLHNRAAPTKALNVYLSHQIIIIVRGLIVSSFPFNFSKDGRIL